MTLCALLALAACGGTDGVPALAPTVEAVDPAVGYSNSETPIRIRGVMPFTPIASLSGDSRVEAPYQVRLGGVPLGQVAWIDPSTLSAVVPTNVPPGVYPLIVRSPSGAEATLDDAFEVLPGTDPAGTGASPTGSLVVESATIGPNTISLGQQVTVTAVIRNTGDAAVREVTATVESTFTGLGAALTAPGPQDIDAAQSATFTWVFRPAATTPVAGITLSVRAAGVDPTSGTAITAAPLATNSMLVNPPAAVTAASSAPASVRPGQRFTVTLTVTNNGSAPADVVPILDPPTTSGLATVSPATGATLDAVRLAGNSPARSFSWEFTSGSGAGTITFNARVNWRDVNSGHSSSAATAAVQVQVATAPTIAEIAPTSGPTAGGTPVAISGTSFVAGATVTFGGAAATSVNVESATRISATTPAHAAGVVSVVVTNPDGQSATRANAFSYVGPPSPPTLTGISPTTGPTTGNFQVTLTGTNLAGGTVLLDGAPLPTTPVNGTTLRVTMPAHAPGGVNLVVRNPDGQTSAARVFTYVAPAPTIAEIAPTSGPTAGGTQVAITGASFVAGATVTFGGAAATDVNVEGPTRITARTPAHAAGTVSVVVSNPDGQSATRANAFSYAAPPPPPTLSGLLPSAGPAAGGDRVTLLGSNFASGATVLFGDAAATITSLTATSISVITPPAPRERARRVDVTVTNPDGQTSRAVRYTYE